jgi:acyl-CoA hydrolase
MLLIAYNDGADCPGVAPADVAQMLGIDDYEILLGWTNASHWWIDTERGIATMANFAVGRGVKDGRYAYMPIRLSSIPAYFRDVRRPEAVVIAGVPRGDGYAFKGTVGWGPAAAMLANSVVVEVDTEAPDLGGPMIPGNIVATVPCANPGLPPAPPRDLDDIDMAVAANVVPLLPDDATIQIGPGGIAEAILLELTKPVQVWSGVITDAIGELEPRGLLTGDVTTGYVWGGEPLVALAALGRLNLLPAEVTHNAAEIAARDRFVALNAALQVGLDGSINIERVGSRVVSGMGGHADFCLGASQSAGGSSIIALRSATRKGHSTIVPVVDVVSTPRTDVDFVVTEHGVADLRGATDAVRRARLILVAAPEHRTMLDEFAG